MTITNVSYVRLHLNELVARAEKGESFEVRQNGKTVFRIEPPTEKPKPKMERLTLPKSDNPKLNNNATNDTTIYTLPKGYTAPTTKASAGFSRRLKKYTGKKMLD